MNKRRFNKCTNIAIKLAQITGNTERRQNRLIEVIESYFCCIKTDFDIRNIKSWEDIVDYIDDELYKDRYLFWDEKHGEDKNKFGHQIKCCMRAAVDLVTDNLGFVAGYTKKDLYKVFDNNIPSWVKRKFNERFFKLPESEYIWL